MTIRFNIRKILTMLLHSILNNVTACNCEQYEFILYNLEMRFGFSTIWNNIQKYWHQYCCVLYKIVSIVWYCQYCSILSSILQWSGLQMMGTVYRDSHLQTRPLQYWRQYRTILTILYNMYNLLKLIQYWQYYNSLLYIAGNIMYNIESVLHIILL